MGKKHEDKNETVAINSLLFDPNATEALDDAAYHFAETQAPSGSAPPRLPAPKPPEPNQNSALKPEQRALLEVVSRLRDSETFEEKNETLAQNGFVKRDFVDQPPLSEQVIPAEAVAAQPETGEHGHEQRDSIHPIDLNGDEKTPQSLIGRTRSAMHEMPSVARRVRKQMRPERIAGPLISCGLFAALFLLPGFLQKQMATGDAGDAQVSAHVSDELDKQIPDALNDQEVAGAAAVEPDQGSSSGAIAGGGTGFGAPGSSGDNFAAEQGGEAVLQGRSLAAKGYYKRARELYRAYLAMHPKAMTLRIELIKMLITGKEPRLARIECIEALKLNPSFEQTQQIAALFQQVQLD